MNFINKYSGFLASIAIVIAIVLGLFNHSTKTEIVKVPVENKNISGVTNYDELQTSSLITTAGAIQSGEIIGSAKGSILDGTNQTCIQNNTGATINVIGSVGNPGPSSASTTLKMAMYSTTTLSTFIDSTPVGGFGALATSSQLIVPYTVYATSTTATTTAAAYQTPIQVPDRSYVCAIVQSSATTSVSVAPPLNYAVATTTTGRGFNPFFEFHYWR